MAKYGSITDLSKNNLVLSRGGGETRIQATGSGTATIKGIVSKTNKPVILSLVNLSTFEVVNKITDNSIYALDTTGLSEISADTSGFTALYAELIEEVG